MIAVWEYDISAKATFLRASFSKKREWEDSREISDFFIFCSINLRPLPKMAENGAFSFRS